MLVLPESTRRVCCANHLLGGLTHRRPTKPPSSCGQSWAFRGLDPRFASLRLCLLRLCPPELSVILQAKWRRAPRSGQKTSWLGWHPDGPPNSPGPGCRPMPIGLRPPRCWPQIMLVYPSLSDISGVRNQDGGEPLLTGGRPSSEVASVQRKALQNRSCLQPSWSAKVSGRGRRG